jgi:fructose-1-phosphate kinase PfkB-like protein
LPTSIYAELIAVAKESGCRTILDASGEGLREGVRAQPSMIKPNRFEMEELCGRQLCSLDDAIEALQLLPVADIELILVSLDDQGCVVKDHDAILAVEPIPTQVVSYAGAGDSLVGGIAMGLSIGVDIRQAITMGFAAATATLAQYGSCFFDLEDYHTNITKVQIREVSHAVP